MNIELFGCAGGMAEGFRRAGITFDLVVDHDPNAIESYERNLGRRPVEMDARDLLRMVRAGWRPGAPVELLVADPPCTPWSHTGSRKGLEDERDMLRETAEMISLLRPMEYLIGNVPGLQNGDENWRVVQRVIGGLAEHGYCAADFIELDAADYGVPQRRVRPFWFGHRAAPCIRWPAPTHGAPDALPGIGRPAWRTCAEALAHLPPEDLGTPIRVTYAKHHRPSKGDRPSRTLTTNPNTDGALIAMLRHHPDGHAWPESEPDAPARTVTGRAGRGGNLLLAHPRYPNSRADELAKTVCARYRGQAGHVMEWPWSRLATTVTALDALGAPGHHDQSEQFGVNAVKLSERAAAILQGFPDGWVFCGKTKRARWSQIGQAVPVQLAQAVATAILERRGRLQEAQDPWSHRPGAPATHGDSPRPRVVVERGGASPEREQERQQALEPRGAEPQGALAASSAEAPTRPQVRGVR